MAAAALDGSPQTKRAKLVETPDDGVHDGLENLGAFSAEKVLLNNTVRKSVCVQGTFEGRAGTGIVLLEKTAFEEDTLKPSSGTFFSQKSKLVKQFHNDIYGNYECHPKAELNGIKVTIIHPATEKHIQKYSTHAAYIIDETPTIYQNFVLPHLLEEQFNLQWVYNILEHKSEVERIVFEDPDEKNGFVLLPDLKWDGKTQETLYLLAIVHARDIKSLRDLRGNHLELLRNIKESGSKAIFEKYGLKSSQLRIYLHYQPSFYHLHVHFTYLQHEGPGINAERSHLLTSVINNLELLPDYYNRATLPFVVRENDGLFKKLEKEGLLQK